MNPTDDDPSSAREPSAPDYWFPAKRYGWGWGPPVRWQGWVVLLVFAVLALLGALSVLPKAGVAAFLVWCLVLIALLFAICWVKGERPSWRWGK